MRNRTHRQISLLLAVIVSIIAAGLNTWPTYAQEPEITPLLQAEITSTPDPTNNLTDEAGDSEPSMQDIYMDDADWMKRMARHCEMMAMMMQMMMDSNGTEQDMQGMMDGSDSMSDPADGDANSMQDMTAESDMMDMMDMMGMMMEMMMGDSDMMHGAADGETTTEPDMRGMDEGS